MRQPSISLQRVSLLMQQRKQTAWPQSQHSSTLGTDASQRSQTLLPGKGAPAAGLEPGKGALVACSVWDLPCTWLRRRCTVQQMDAISGSNLLNMTATCKTPLWPMYLCTKLFQADLLKLAPADLASWVSNARRIRKMTSSAAAGVIPLSAGSGAPLRLLEAGKNTTFSPACHGTVCWKVNNYVRQECTSPSSDQKGFKASLASVQAPASCSFLVSRPSGRLSISCDIAAPAVGIRFLGLGRKTAATLDWAAGGVSVSLCLGGERDRARSSCCCLRSRLRGRDCDRG